VNPERALELVIQDRDTPRPPRRDPWIGRTLDGRYRIVQHLADGGMGRVYVGEQLQLGMPVAVKLLDAKAWADATLAGRFEREATATALLRHPHVVQVFDWGALPEGGYYLVLELLPGADLASVLMGGGMLGVARTLHVLRQLARALDHAHAHGIVHRDLKPENVMIDEGAGDFVKIVDFGVAHDLRSDGTYSGYGEVIGTPEYMSPEQALGMHDRIGPASDRYSFAAIALEMLTGDLPYPSAPATTTLRMIVEAPPRRPSELGLSIAGLDEVFDRAMARRPDDRFESARAFVDRLEEVLRPSESPRARPCDPVDGSGVRLRPAVAEPIELGRARAMGAAALADLPADEASMARVTAAIVLTGLGLVGSAFAAGWVACLALAG
jgi:serine/threonine-protein kinase